MILFGWRQQTYHQPGDGDWLPLIFGCVAGVVPWVVIVVYAIVVSLFAFFNVFAVVQWLQYRPVGRFADCLLGERASIV